MKETKFLAPILLESPLMFEILEKIREKYSIDKLDPNKDPYKQRVRQDMEQDPPIDWQAVRQAKPYPAHALLRDPQVPADRIVCPTRAADFDGSAPSVSVGIWRGKGDVPAQADAYLRGGKSRG